MCPGNQELIRQCGKRGKYYQKQLIHQSDVSNLIRMNLFHRTKYECDQDEEKFKTYEELIEHARHVHHHPIVKCHNCGKEFIHEKDRLHHEREEHDKIVDYRLHKTLDTHNKKTSPQEEVYDNTRNFGDNF